mmetsp:Transcript_21704/g.53623  ORF Transcript_21704/g.53623 Transcript_21704/m.53623 type:complete len:1229 (+) Transcript_21704:221-3907(+)|eukprot:CAMPEP_0113623518 /NCGR_PEP_ID=MMETSP0017_2-20120614/12101_1 /TAXON_ID=2856 /ORGANISM="Cylindrotheca closterium" /LENGTH=1228 /DNA_ID=CAMNT_0000533475 /DNA_START=169 /DNA_END=3855 /DNA_ORIENTATION=+ /assembly_acc=CAM_ASM_000147
MAKQDESSTGDSSSTIQQPSSGDDETVMSTDRSTGVAKSFSHRLTRAKIHEPADIERTTIICLRHFIAFLMIVATVAAALITWSILEQVESEDFENKVEVIAEDIRILSHQRILKLLSNYRSLSWTISGLAINSQSEWPFFADSSFPMIATSVMNKTKTHVVFFAPVVHNLTESEEWSRYSQANQKWIKDGVEMKQMVDMAISGRRLQENNHDAHHGHQNHETTDDIPDIFPDIFHLEAGEKVAEDGPGPFLPSWQMVESPRDPSVINYNLLSESHFADVFNAVVRTNSPTMTDLLDRTLLDWDSLLDHSQHAHHSTSPFSMVLYPVYKDVSREEVVAMLMSDVDWITLFALGSDEATPPVHVVVDEGCERKFTFEVSGPRVEFVGYDDFRDPKFDVYERSFPFPSDLPSVHLAGEECSYSIHVYPTTEFWEAYHTGFPELAACIVGGVFLLMCIILLGYDVAIRMRQRRIARDASRSEQILSVLYPKIIRDRLFEQAEDGDRDRANHSLAKAPKYRLKKFLGSAPATQARALDISDSKPIADFFMDCTVLFADISGFTAWSSVREPVQVFTLLESVYHAFDVIAKRRQVFKVETIGDCYLAVTGLPEPTKEHATLMSFFARECVNKFKHLVGTLETTLGPDTGDLGIRVGMHSGPVTAGVLRGDKSRFQLFGDTVNTASRIESTGRRNRIQVSEETADLLAKAGKRHLLEERSAMVEVKGKGRLQTFWLLTVDEERHRFQKIRRPSRPGLTIKSFSEKFSPMSKRKKTSIGSLSPRNKNGTEVSISPHRTGTLSPRTRERSAASQFSQIEQLLPLKSRRLCQWNVDILVRQLKQIVAFRKASKRKKNAGRKNLAKQEKEFSKQRSTLDEVVEIIPLPGFDAEANERNQDPNDVELPDEVVDQVKLFVASIAMMYRNNPFHNFEHASHVTMSVSKLLSRIVAADDILNRSENAANSKDFCCSIHDHTYGITSDPMTQFTVILAALIHDVDHLGVSNAHLVKEGHELADLFENKSVAEQNSIAMAWDLLMDPRFVDFRYMINTDEFELSRFRQLIANTVLATDIMDKELQALRRKRWEVAFKGSIHSHMDDTMDKVNRKATIVIEHLIQASDVSHTMQHWHVYCRWNERLFQEMVVAYKSGRLDFNPADKWYEGELGFFDNYVIPLAKKLKDCGVFGVASDEYLMYAQENRREFEEKGREFVSEMEDRYIHCTEELQKSSSHIPGPLPL